MVYLNHKLVLSLAGVQCTDHTYSITIVCIHNYTYPIFPEQLQDELLQEMNMRRKLEQDCRAIKGNAY